MKKLLIELAIIAGVVLSVVAAVNIYVDPANIFHESYEKEIFDGLKDGRYVTNVQNFDDRLLKRELIELYANKEFDYLVLGASRCLSISSDNFKDKRLLNLGVTSGQIEDFLAFYEICAKHNLKIHNVILVLDPVMFNQSASNTLWQTNASYFYQIIGENEPFIIDNKIKSIFSPSYYQNSLNYIKHPSEFSALRDLFFVDQSYNDEMTYCPDGSRLYGKKIANASQEIVDREAETYNHGLYLQNEIISEEYVQYMNLLFKLYAESHTNIIICKFPFHPILFSKINNNCFKEEEKYINELASNYGAKIIGSYNPAENNITNGCFYDGLHPKFYTVKLILEKLENATMEKQKD